MFKKTIIQALAFSLFGLSEPTYAWYQYETLADGTTVKVTENGTLYKDRLGKFNVIKGKWETFYSSGQLESVAHYRRGRKYGPYEMYYPDGSPSVKGEYFSDKRVGKWVFFEGENARATRTYQFFDGEGLVTMFHENGQLVEEYYTKGRYKNGRYHRWDSTGNLLESGIYNEGFKAGVWKVIRSDGNYVDETHQESLRIVWRNDAKNRLDIARKSFDAAKKIYEQAPEENQEEASKALVDAREDLMYAKFDWDKGYTERSLYFVAPEEYLTYPKSDHQITVAYQTADNTNTKRIWYVTYAGFSKASWYQTGSSSTWTHPIDTRECHIAYYTSTYRGMSYVDTKEIVSSNNPLGIGAVQHVDKRRNDRLSFSTIGVNDKGEVVLNINRDGFVVSSGGTTITGNGGGVSINYEKKMTRNCGKMMTHINQQVSTLKSALPGSLTTVVKNDKTNIEKIVGASNLIEIWRK